MDEQPRTLIDALIRSTATHGDDRGLRFYDAPGHSEYLTLGELDRQARAVAAKLQAAGYGPGDTAVIAVSQGLPWASAVWGALYAGLAFLPAPVAGYGSPERMAEAIAGIARAGEAKALITDHPAYEGVGGSLPGVDIPALYLEDLALGDPDAWTKPDLAPDSIAYLLFTSGSTGDPKGVIATHEMVVGTAIANQEIFGSGPDAVVLTWAPMHHIMGLVSAVMLPAINAAESVVMTTELFQRRPMMWLQLMSDHGATMSAAGNFAFDLVTRFATDEQVAQLDLSKMRSLFSGSEPVRPETVRAFLERFAPTGITESAIAPVMGMTESMLISGKFLDDELVIRRFDRASLEEGALVASDGEGSVEWVSCGRPNSQTSVKIVDPDTLEPVADGTVGEIWVSSPMVSPGYFRRPDATAETFGLKLPGDDRGYMRTGDLAAILDGQLYVTGRLKDMIIIRGRNLYPQDIEAAAQGISPVIGVGAAFELAGHPSAVGLVAEFDAEALEASGQSLDDLSDVLRRELMTRFSLPSIAIAFVPAGQLPRTGTGKVRRAPTRARIDSGTLPTVHASGLATATAG